MSASRKLDTSAARPRSSSRTDKVLEPSHGQGQIPIVAIGASAGGLDACRVFLEALPAKTGMAFIFVQHLDPSHKSLIVDLLKEKTKLTVLEAVDGTTIEAEHFYVIAPGTYLSVDNGLLHTSRPGGQKHVRLPFDCLLKSLAADVGAAAMGVILSGTGTDGSAGLADINRVGGLIVVQKPEDAAYDGMPRSAIMTGLADQVLPVAQIPQALADHAAALAEKHKLKQPAATQPEPHEPPSLLAEIIDLVHAKTGHDFRHYKGGTLKRRVVRRMGLAAIQNTDFRSYLDLLRGNHEELVCLAKDFLINVTSFFRDQAIFDQLAKTTIPNLVKTHSLDHPIRVWIAGCSSGEEAYSMAILFREAISAAGVNMKLQLFASDVDAEAIAVAREGFYPLTIAAEVSEQRLARFFSKGQRGYRVLPELRSMVVFTEQDVLADPPFSRIDMISCRNLMIYLDPQAQAKVISLFHFALREQGILLLGSSETVGKTEGRFETISKSARLYRHIGNSRPGDLRFSMSPTEAGRALASPGPAAVLSHEAALASLCQQMVMDNYAPAAVLINKRHECLYSQGAIHKYLAVAPGRPTHDIFAMLAKPLQTKLRSAIQRSGQQQKRIVTAGGQVTIDGKEAQFSIQVEPTESEGQPLFLICFVDEPATKPRRKDSAETPEANSRIIALESELEVTKAELNGAIRDLEISGEEQRAINQESASFNEENQSANEELLTSKEELQSLNEELTALNGQLQETLERQRTTANDLKNVLYSTAVATLFLDKNLNIRFFTPATKALFKVIASDIGRPLSDLNSLAVDVALISDAALVLKTHKPIELEIETTDGTAYMRRVLPYLGNDKSVEGIVITFVDVTEQRQNADALELAKRQADQANAAKSRFLAAASHDLRQPLQTLSLLQGLLVRSVEGEKPQSLLARAGETLGSMSVMLNALLDINQIEAGIVQAKFVNYPIQDLLSELRAEFGVTAQSKDLSLRVVDCGLTISTDPQLLGQMVRNLLSNAFKYTQTGKVLLGCRRRDGILSIEVWDTGIGIPANELQSVFDEYHQLDNQARERSKGLGLGLSIVRRLSDLLGHKIKVKSRPSKGSVFAIEATLVKSEAVVSTAVEALPVDPEIELHHGRKIPILLVEDDQEVRELLDQLLTDEGHAVSSAHDGPSAIALAGKAQHPPELILADFNIPGGMSGMQVVGKLREQFRRTIPAIVLTGDISSQALSQIAGQNLVRLAKPVKFAEVEEVIQTLLAEMADSDRLEAAEPAVDADASNTVFVIDDDDALLQTLRLVLEKHGLTVETYASCEAFLKASHPRDEGCLLVDGHLPGMNGLELLQHLKENGRNLKSIMMTGNSDVAMAVNAMKAGASDFIEKPLEDSELLDAIDRALEQSKDNNKQAAFHLQAANLIASLTARQRQILKMVLQGHPSKNIAADLGISQRTVENHRASIMSKTGSKSLPALARLALAAAEGSEMQEA